MLSADEILNLKARIDTELVRRSYNGSLSNYANSDYNFEINPSSNNPIYMEQGQKIMEQILQINDIGDLYYEDMKPNTMIPNSFDYEPIDKVLAKYEKETLSQNSTSCRGACT